MGIVERGAREHHPMRMKRRRGDRAGAILLEKARIGFDVVEERAVDIE